MTGDFSWFALFLAGLATVAQAYTQPKGAEPTGNPISKPGLNDIVPAGKPYTITWNPTTQDTVTLLLLRGPSTDIKPLYPIVEKIPNSGHYIWVPSTDLTPDVTHYGIQLICDDTGAYQYTTQFGISNPSYGKGSSSSESSSATGHPSGYGSVSTKATETSTRSVYHVSTSTSLKPSYVASTGYPAGNSSVVYPTGTLSVPHSLKTTHKPTAYSTTVLSTSALATTPTTQSPSTSAEAAPTSTFTGAAAKLYGAAGGVVAVAAAAVFAL